MRELPHIRDREILAARPAKNAVDPRQAYARLVEPEFTADGRLEDVATIFLTNRECPFRCLMCDLWKNTTDHTLPLGAIPSQIDDALARLPPAAHVKLYNSGNFFDPRAIPPADHATIAERLMPFRTVIVENHPRFCGDGCLRFRDRISGQLEIAIGLETVHPQILPRLNKQMTADDFAAAVRFLTSHGIRVRAFLLLRPPFLDEQDGVEWSLRSIEFAFDAGVECCSVIPTRSGNGILERLKADGLFSPPRLESMEHVLAAGLAMRRGRVFMDLWDAERFSLCARCFPARRERIRQMNHTQQIAPAVTCDCEVPA